MEQKTGTLYGTQKKTGQPPRARALPAAVNGRESGRFTHSSGLK
jgi:hypothetical protein